MPGRARKNKDWKSQLEIVRSKFCEDSDEESESGDVAVCITDVISEQLNQEKHSSIPNTTDNQSLQHGQDLEFENVFKPDKPEEVQGNGGEIIEIDVSLCEGGKMGNEARGGQVEAVSEKEAELTPEQEAEIRRMAVLKAKYNKGFSIAALGVAAVTSTAVMVSVVRGLWMAHDSWKNRPNLK